MKIAKKIYALLIGMLVMPVISFAQCSVCSAGLASSRQAGSNVALGINTGILYLLVFPYIIFMGFIIFRYREFIAFKYRMFVQRWRMFWASHSH